MRWWCFNWAFFNCDVDGAMFGYTCDAWGGRVLEPRGIEAINQLMGQIGRPMTICKTRLEHDIIKYFLRFCVDYKFARSA